MIVTFALIYRMVELVKYTVKNPLLDTTFKKVFRHPQCMVSLLSSIYEEDLTTVQYLSESPNGSGKGSIVLDLHCQTPDGKHYIVEVQYSSTCMSGFEERAQLYSAVLLSTHWEETIAKANVKIPMYNKYTMLQPVRILAFVNYPLDIFKKNEQHGPIHRYKLTHEKSLTNDLKLLDYTFVDLHAMRQLSRGDDKSIHLLQQRLAQKNELYDWLYYLTCFQNETVSVPKTCRAIEAYKLCSNLSEAELRQYKRNEQEQADFNSCIIAGRTDLQDEIRALKEQIQALQKELTQSRSSSTDLQN